MKTLLTISTLALAASPLSAIILSVPFQSQTFDIVTASASTFMVSSPSGTQLVLGQGLGLRPNQNGLLAPTSTSVEGATWYQTFIFTPTVSSTTGITSTYYDFSDQFGSTTDGFMALYINSYNPASPVTNALIANNDSGVNPDQSSFSYPLIAGQQYVLLSTLNNGDTTGANPTFSTLRSVNTNINGPGPLVFTPPGGEPVPFGVDSTLGLVVLGAIGALRLRRRTA